MTTLLLFTLSLSSSFSSFKNFPVVGLRWLLWNLQRLIDCRSDGVGGVTLAVSPGCDNVDNDDTYILK